MINTLRFLLLLAVITTPKSLLSQEIEEKPGPQYTVYLVRHGEKLPGNDPELSEAGKKRAGDLYRLLKDKKIDVIYSTPYKRTMMTGDSLRIYQKIDTVLYKADATGEGYLEAVKRNSKMARNILIIAHSNTIGTILRKLGAADNSFKDLEDHEYNHIYIIDVKDSKIKLKKEEYGSANPVVPTGNTMKGN